MKENDVYTLVVATLTAGFTRLALVDNNEPLDLTIQQAYQPREQGAPEGAAILLQNIKTRRYGFLYRKDEWDLAAKVERHTETQQMQVTLQCNALSPPVNPAPAPLPAYTAGDLVNYAAAILQSDAGCQQLRAGGVGIERVTDIRQPYFTDDRQQFEASPSFDFTLDFEWSMVTETPIITATEFKIFRV